MSRFDSFSFPESVPLQFNSPVERLRWMALVITGDESKAGACLRLGLDMAGGGRAAFTDGEPGTWLYSWQRNCVLLHSVRTVMNAVALSADQLPPVTQAYGLAQLPRPLEANARLVSCTVHDLTASLRSLNALSRCVYLLRSLEKLPRDYCSRLLGLSPRVVEAAERLAAIELTSSLLKRLSQSGLG